MQPETITQIYSYSTIIGAGLITATSIFIGNRRLLPVIGIGMVGKTLFDVITSEELSILSANILSMLGLYWSTRLTENNNLTNQE